MSYITSDLGISYKENKARCPKSLLETWYQRYISEGIHKNRRQSQQVQDPKGVWLDLMAQTSKKRAPAWSYLDTHRGLQLTLIGVKMGADCVLVHFCSTDFENACKQGSAPRKSGPSHPATVYSS